MTVVPKRMHGMLIWCLHLSTCPRRVAAGVNFNCCPYVCIYIYIRMYLIVYIYIYRYVLVFMFTYILFGKQITGHHRLANRKSTLRVKHTKQFQETGGTWLSQLNIYFIVYCSSYWLWQPYSNTDPYCSRKTPSFRELEPQNTGIFDSQIMKETSHPTCTLTSRCWIRFVWVSSQTAWSSPSQWSVSNRETSKVYLPWPRKVWKFTLFDGASSSTICSICIFLFRPFDTLMFVLYPLSFFECFSRCLFLRQSEILLVPDRVGLSQFCSDQKTYWLWSTAMSWSEIAH